MSAQRDTAVDFFRGVVIINMILVHFSSNFPGGIAFIIESLDFAIEGFVFLAGVMIGKHYLPKFTRDKRDVVKRLFSRAAKLVVIQYIMILTISLPFYSYFYLNGYNENFQFAVSSFLFLNQIPILHILPTFIPLFILSPVILFLLFKNYDFLLMAISVGVFLLGCYDPYIFIIKEKAIFPVVLWQIYFVVGSIAGKFSSKNMRLDYNRLFISAVLLYMICFLMKYGGYYRFFHDIKAQFDIYPKKFPLNVYGFLYGSSLLFLLYALTVKLWSVLKKCASVFNVLSLFGRYSLLVFIIHAYFVYLIRSAKQLGMETYIVSALIAGTFIVTYKLSSLIDQRYQRNELPFAYRWLLS